MSANTTIEWTDHTFNPWWGCARVSAGCSNCYAETFAHRFGVEWGKGATRRPASEKVWAEPRRWNEAAKKAGQRVRVFCSSMADVFDPEAPEHALSRLFDLIRFTPWLDWQLLTKRPENIRDALPADWGKGYRNVWLGVSVENQAAADKRIPLVLETTAAVRFLSCEPLLGPVDLQYPAFNGADSFGKLEGIHWVIAGGESGPGARPMHPDWARSLRDQCQAAGVPFLFKQWGAWTPGENVADDRRYPSVIHFNGAWEECSDDWATEADHGPILYRVGKSKAGRLLDGVTHDAFPGVA